MRGRLGAGSRVSGSGRCRGCPLCGSRSGRGRWSHPGAALQTIKKCFPLGNALLLFFRIIYILIYEASFESVELWIKCFCQVVIFVSKTSTANCYCRRLENPGAASRGRNKCWNWQMAAIGICVIEWGGLLTAGSSTSVVHWTGNSIIYINILFDSKCITSTLESFQILRIYKVLIVLKILDLWSFIARKKN